MVRAYLLRIKNTAIHLETWSAFNIEWFESVYALPVGIAGSRQFKSLVILHVIQIHHTYNFQILFVGMLVIFRRNYLRVF